ncbi:MAG: helix-turn-helix transcriptional regulator [Clostridia bacterium]|nr:helix-turn-helix transcriptional regulator [Clostridia bacterium]
MTIGEACKIRILNLCEERGITVNKLAIISGITQSTLNNIVSGRNNSMTVSTVKKLCDGLEISVTDFFCDVIFEDLEQEIK